MVVIFCSAGWYFCILNVRLRFFTHTDRVDISLVPKEDLLARVVSQVPQFAGLVDGPSHIRVLVW